MVIHDLNLLGSLCGPTETDAVTLIDPDAVLASAVASETLETVTGRGPQVLKRDGRFDLVHLALSDRPEG
jgi:hypothetical protein